MSTRGLLDTSVFIARESGRRLAVDLLPDEGLVCVVTLAEIRAGVLAARDTEVRARRMRTLEVVSGVSALPVDAAAAGEWATLRVRLHESGRRMGVNDTWIAAVAMAHDLPVHTQDADFDVAEELGLLSVVRV